MELEQSSPVQSKFSNDRTRPKPDQRSRSSGVVLKFEVVLDSLHYRSGFGLFCDVHEGLLLESM